MKLKLFNAVNTPKLSGGGNKAARMSVSKNGVIHINGTACALMDMKAGDKITLAQDEEDSENWYLFKSEDGFEVRTAYDKKGILFNHATLSKLFITEIERDPYISNNFLIAGQPTTVKGDKTKYWGIIIPASV